MLNGYFLVPINSVNLRLALYNELVVACVNITNRFSLVANSENIISLDNVKV